MKALVSFQDLPAFELFAADLADERVAAREDPLKTPNAVTALRKAAESASRMGILMGSQIFVSRRAFTAGTVCPFNRT